MLIFYTKFKFKINISTIRFAQGECGFDIFSWGKPDTPKNDAKYDLVEKISQTG